MSATGDRRKRRVRPTAPDDFQKPCVVRVHGRRAGDTWGFWIITDRIPLAIGIVAVYFGFRVTSLWVGLVYLAAMGVPLVWTMPRRYSLAIALVYLGRRAWPDPDDELPPLPPQAQPWAAAR